MKKVDEGVELFDEIWEKVYSAESQNQKEKHEVDLKKEIKKLQRLRDQIKTWIGSSDVKDKDNLVDARKLIETKMEQFKVCEKETKTKTYSKEGLARAEKLSPEEQAKHDTCEWVGEMIQKLQQLVEDKDVEIESLSSGKGKKTNRHLIEENNEFIQSHRFHINKLEGIMRLVMNDVLDHELVDDLKEDLEYYIESHDEEEYMQGYDEEYFYETLGLEDIGVVNVDRVTQVSSAKSSSSKNDDASSQTSSVKDKKSKKKASANTMIPLKIGRATSKRDKLNGEDKESEKEPITPAKKGPNSSALGPSPATPAARAPPPVSANGGASMAAILKRESEQQEKERQKQAAIEQALKQVRMISNILYFNASARFLFRFAPLQRLVQEQQARHQAELQQRQQLQRRHEELQRQQEELRQQQAAAQQKTQQEALQRHQLEQQQRTQQEAAVKKQQQLHAAQQLQKQRSQSSTPGSQQDASIDLLPVGLGAMSLGDSTHGSPSATMNKGSDATVGSPTSARFDASSSYLGALDESFLHCPSNADSERQRTYTPRNSYPTPSSYPTNPSPIFENPAIFENLGTDCLFFIFYYAQGTYQQYLAARELKKQSWRYHEKYMTWFQRHEEPKVTTEDYEQGTYVYFDYESGWCQRIKSDFRFEYSYLEDSLQ
jgi:CCR4-NOT transcription complex subunit 3